ncbi:SpoIIE family protein phosphatase [Kitasatospora sp. NPDC058965]|uniref:ATP-binding SpoIIE family protein phosphatase n=1 Tax=Kitasatospora sp. NPDC058965 TaxID=3346682 RepID=UPI003685F811
MPNPHDQDRARRQLQLVYEASRTVGESLDVTDTARALADVLVPALGDLATVDVAQLVLAGEEPLPPIPGALRAPTLRRVALKNAFGGWPAGMVAEGEALPEIPLRPEYQEIYLGGSVVVGSAEQSRELLGGDPRLIRLMMPPRMHTSLGTPLYARGLVLGFVMVYRTRESAPFDDEDTRLLAEIATRAALHLDNARRYTREHRLAEALQRSLLPPGATSSAAAETAGFFVPAHGGSGGDWFDVLGLSSLRTGLVVGDVIGHGLAAATGMARMRTAVQTLAEQDLDPEDLLTRLDDVVQRMGEEAELPDSVGATCLYAVYDPVTAHCRLASAGHLAPLVLRPGGDWELVDVSPGPPLGVGGSPFEVTEVQLPEGSVLALYTDGLVRRRDAAGTSLSTVRAWLTAACRPGRPLAEIGAELVDRVPAPPVDDVVLLLARTRTLSPGESASWTFPPDPGVVAEARSVVAAQLVRWGLEELVFTSELVVSELVTNGIRYGGGGPVGLRLICHGHRLVYEVTDASNTQPRLRRARTTDEGGRGLFLVAQLTTRWGSRYGSLGKTIWAEQSLPDD